MHVAADVTVKCIGRWLGRSLQTHGSSIVARLSESWVSALQTADLTSLAASDLFPLIVMAEHYSREFIMLSWNGRSTSAQSIDCDLHHQSRGESRRWLGGLVAILLSAVTLGCGETLETVPTGEATGKITVGGKPLTQGRVNFVSDAVGAGAGGNLTPDGTYKLEGAIPVGHYSVFITFDIPPALRGTPAENVLKSVPEKYLGQATSGLTADVEEGQTEYNFDLK